VDSLILLGIEIELKEYEDLFLIKNVNKLLLHEDHDYAIKITILDLSVQHQYDIKIDVNAKYVNQKKKEMNRITANLKTVYVKKLKI
jgi:hypothetical protein